MDGFQTYIQVSFVYNSFIIRRYKIFYLFFFIINVIDPMFYSIIIFVLQYIFCRTSVSELTFPYLIITFVVAHSVCLFYWDNSFFIPVISKPADFSSTFPSKFLIQIPLTVSPSCRLFLRCLVFCS